ncbi:hypothetical protein [Streptomyces carpaticus]|uniref:DUF4350 domain-containing protein n=1 Tax=Streptomyces carpaticus TaxID=285558 RepID=A0ABV4ZME3_9ACTN
MRVTGGRRAWLAGVLGVLLACGLLTAPPARAAGQLDEAIAALSGGETVWVAEDYAGVSPELVELLRARYAGADTTVRIAFVTEEIGEDAAASQQLAAAVGEPGVYMVHSEVRSALSDSPDRSEQSTTVGLSLDEWALFDEEMDRVGINEGNFLLTLPDLLDQDVTPGVRALAEDGGYYVDPAVTEAFPELDEELLASAFAEVPGLRVALVSGVSGPTDATMAALADGLADDGAALLLRFEDDDFSAVMATGPDVPYTISDLVNVVGGSAITEIPVAEMPGRLALLASALAETDPLAAAGERLGGQSLFVHPGVPGFDREAEYEQALAEAGRPVKVAFLPENVLALRLGEDLPWSGDDTEPAGLLAEHIDWGTAPEADHRVVVYRFSPYHGGHISGMSVAGDADFVQSVGSARAGGDDFAAGSLDALLDAVGAPAPETGGSGGGAGDDRAAGGGGGGGGRVSPWPLVALFGLLPLGLLVRETFFVLSPRRRRIRAARARARKLARMTPQQLAKERERAELPALAARQDLEKLDEALAGLPMPRTSPRQVRALQRIRSEHERLLQAHTDAVTWEDVRSIRERAGRLTRALELWRRTEARPAD